MSAAEEPEYIYESGQDPEARKMTDDELVHRLRERGFQLDCSPCEKEAAAARLASGEPIAGDLVPCFAYVRIPANEKEGYEEITSMLPLMSDGSVPAGDNIPFIVKRCFADRQKGIDETVLQEHARSTLGAQAAHLTSRAFTEATLDGSVETFALVRPAEANGQVGVYIYLDEVGVIKQLPPNPRANAIAHACGQQNVSFHGDVFVGRVAMQPTPMHNVDFKIKDMDSSSDWVKQAPGINYEYGIGMKEVESALNSKENAQHVKMGGFEEGEFPGGQGPDGKYSWTQTKDDVEVAVPLPEGTRAKELAVTIKRESMLVKLGPMVKLVDVGKLNAQIDVDDSTWSVEGSKDAPMLVLTLQKARFSIWRMLSADGTEGT